MYFLCERGWMKLSVYGWYNIKKKEDYFTISPEFQLFRSFVSMGQGKAQQSHVLLYHLSYDESMKTSQ
jgi:hypothetical protein